MTKTQVLRELSIVAGKLATIEERRGELYARRLALYQEGRRLAPDLTQRQMAEAAGVREVSVIAALKKARTRKVPPPASGS